MTSNEHSRNLNSFNGRAPMQTDQQAYLLLSMKSPATDTYYISETNLGFEQRSSSSCAYLTKISSGHAGDRSSRLGIVLADKAETASNYAS